MGEQLKNTLLLQMNKEQLTHKGRKTPDECIEDLLSAR